MKTGNSIVALLACGVLAIISMFGLYAFSKKELRYQNSITRLFPPGMSEQMNTEDLGFNSYYFAGSGNGKLYLGNSTAPLLITVLNTNLTLSEKLHIKLNIATIGMRYPQVKIDPPYFYIYEGSVPYIYRGSISDWRADLKINSGHNFSQMQPVGPSQVVARFIDTEASKNILGLADLETKSTMLKPGLLSGESIFDTDGILLFDKVTDEIAYIRYYSNKILITDINLSTVSVAKTIDTLDNPQLKIATVNNERTFSKMPVLANRLAHFDSGWIFVNSQIMGHSESKERWNESSIIDIYDSSSKGYVASFYIDDIAGTKARSFWIDGDTIYVLGGSKIIRYKFRKFLAQ